MCLTTRGADEGEVKVGILELRVVGEDFVDEEWNRLVIIVPSD